MADSLAASDLLTALLGAGGVGFIGMAYKAVKDYREGTWKRRDGAVADLEKWRQSADDARHTAESDRDWEATQGRYYYNYSGDLERVIRVELGEPRLPIKPPFPIRPVLHLDPVESVR